MNVTRNVIHDLWPLYGSGEASDDTRALVDAFLDAHPEVRDTMPKDFDLNGGERPVPAPDAEAKAFTRVRDYIHGRSWLRGVRIVALAFTGLTVARIVEDTSFDVSPKRVIATAIAAAVCWTIYVLALRFHRSKMLRR